MPILLHHFDPQSERMRVTALPINNPGDTCTIYVRPLPGAFAVHILLEAKDSRAGSLRAEVEALPTEAVPIGVAWGDDNSLQVSSSSSRVFTLPADERYSPPRPLIRPSTGKLDVLLLLDGTSRLFSPNVLAQSNN